MEFKKKLRTRLYIGVSYIIIGIALIIISLVLENSNEFLSPYGTTIAVIGLVRIKHYFAVTKNEETIRMREIAETDERNLEISKKAKSYAFNFYVILASVAIIVLQLLHYEQLVNLLGITVCALITIYWVSYFIIRKKF